MKNILLLLALTGSATLYAQNIGGNEVDDFILKNRQGSGQSIVQTDSNSSNVEDELGGIDDVMLDTVIYNDIHNRRSHRKEQTHTQNGSKAARGGILLSTPATDMAKMISQQEEKRRSALEKEKAEKAKLEKEKKSPTYFTGGYCTVMQEVRVIRSSEFVNLDCLLDFGKGEFRDATVFAGVYPNYKKESLIALPIMVTFKNQNKAVMNGVVMSEGKSTLNIADKVEHFKIRELIAESGLEISDVAYRYASAYLQQKIVSNTVTKIDYIPTQTATGIVNTPIVTQETVAPKAKDYWTAAGLELFSKLFSIGAKNILEDTNPLFYTRKNKRIWVEGVVSFDADGGFGKYGMVQKETKGAIDKDNNSYEQAKEELINRAGNSAANSSGSVLNSITSGVTNMQNTGTRTVTPYVQ